VCDNTTGIIKVLREINADVIGLEEVIHPVPFEESKSSLLIEEKPLEKSLSKLEHVAKELGLFYYIE
jgi:hypothetical protein